MTQKLLIVFVAVTSVAVVIQTAILAGMFVTFRKMGERIGQLEGRLSENGFPLIEKARIFLDESAPKLQAMLDNMTESTAIVRSQAARVDAAVGGIIDVAQAQAEHASRLASRTIERLDSTAQTVQHGVQTQLRNLSAILTGIAAGFGEFTGRQRARRTTDAGAPNDAPKEEMFI